PWLNGLETALLVVFGILFSWISFGFWTAIAGFLLLCRRSERPAATDLPREDASPLRSKNAVLMPICNEDPERVFAGLETIFRCVARTGHLAHFDFYALSDTGDWEAVVDEEVAWAKTCKAVDGFGKIFYRHRKNNIKRKSGNIADFLRRWGADYDHMIVLDADSLMAGATMVRLVRLMERSPRAGIIQSVPATVNRESLFARAQQFAGRVYGPMLAAGLHYWQLGESAYWGHNAILRVEAFVKNCGLRRLPGRPPLGGEILSHDFVEAALMGRAGWEVWLARDLEGSYEETPPTLLDELKRDRRWCQGNMQHLRLVLANGIRGGHRALFSMGIMAYASALFWAAFLALSTMQLATESIYTPNYFPTGPSLFPLWPHWHPEWALALLSTTAALLFAPKFLSLLVILIHRRRLSFGGILRLTLSVILEIGLSALLAPIRMWFHAQFVLLTLIGRPIKWGPQPRSDAETDWSQAIRAHGASIVFAACWILAAFWVNPASSWWVLPVAVPLLFSAPISVYTSKVPLGRAFKKIGLFLIPEERDPPEVVQELRDALAKRKAERLTGFILAAVDPEALAVHGTLMRGKSPRSAAAVERNRELREKALSDGPKSLSASERARLLNDADSMAALYVALSERRAADDDTRAAAAH
ncbi:MAG TPA: glucans biosynthesis glucosyltransferase MdoH, partial [Candidatus Binatia bacterium]